MPKDVVVNFDDGKLLSFLKECKFRIDNLDDFPALRDHIRARDKHRNYLKSKRSEDIEKMTKEELESFFDGYHMWSSSRRSTIKHYIAENGFERIRALFTNLYKIAERNDIITEEEWNDFFNIKYMGRAWISEILSAINNDRYVLYNDSTYSALQNFGITGISKSTSYKSFLNALQAIDEISKKMKEIGFKDYKLYDVDGLLNYSLDLMKEDSEPKYWYFAPGENAFEWDIVVKEKIAAIGWNEIGDLRQYGSKKEMENAIVRANAGKSANSTWYFSHVMKKGDILFARKGLRQIIGVGVVKGNYRHLPEREPHGNVVDVEWTVLSKPIETLTQTGMESITPVPNDSIGYLLDKCGFSKKDKEKQINEIKNYSVEKLLEETFLTRGEFDTIKELLLRKNNIILKGAPGVGKTYLARRIAYAIMEEKDPTRLEFVQFHQNYSYEEFIIGYKPDGDGFSLEEGVFFKFCDEARKDRSRKYFFIIDEINRGNLSKIFGEMLVLIESDKREGSEDGITLKTAYGDKPFNVPDNLYIIGMMNTADRSLALIDYALRRRFAFFTLRSKFGDSGFIERLSSESNISEDLAEKICDRMVKVNKKITEKLGEGYEIGHSFFIRKSDIEGSESTEDDWYDEVVRYEILPLLEEYFFDDPETIKVLMKILDPEPDDQQIA